MNNKIIKIKNNTIELSFYNYIYKFLIFIFFKKFKKKDVINKKNE